MIRTVLVVFSSVLLAIGKFLYNFIYGAYNIVRSLMYTIFAYKIELLIIVALFGVGYPLANKQPMAMQTFDIGYECFVFRAAHYTGKLLYAVNVVYFWLDSRINDGILWIRQCVAEGIQNIRDAQGNTIDKVVEIVEAIIDIFLCFLESAYNIPSWIIPYFSDILQIIIVAFVNLVDAIQTQFAQIAKGEWFSEDCSFCDIYENDYQPDYRCRFMESSFSEFGVNCNECDTFVNDIIDILAGILNGILELCGLDQSLIVYNLADNFKCIFNLAKRVYFIIFAFIDDAIYNGNCIDTEQFFREIGRWGLDIIGCFDDLMYTITQGQVNSFFEYLFSVILKFFYDIINGIKLIIDCYQTEEQTDCLTSWPDSCAYSEVPPYRSSDGLQTCAAMASACLSEIPFLVNLTDVGPSHFNFFDFGPVLASFIDDVVCFFEIVIECSQDPPGAPHDQDDDLGQTEARLACMADRIPGLRGLFQFIINVIDFFNTIARGITQTIECFSDDCVTEGFSGDFLGSGDSCSIGEAIGCIPKCFGDPYACAAANTGKRKRDYFNYDLPNDTETLLAIARNTWSEWLETKDIYRDTHCGKLLHSKSPGWFKQKNVTMDYGEYNAYWSCLGMLTINHHGKGYAGSFMLPMIVSYLRPHDLADIGAYAEKRSMRRGDAKSGLKGGSHVKSYLNSFKKTLFKNSNTSEDIGVISYIKDNIMGMFNKTGYYNLTYDFVIKMQALKSEMHGNTSDVNYEEFTRVSKGIYVEYGRSLLSHHSDVMNEYKRGQSLRKHYVKYSSERKGYLPKRVSLSELEKKADVLNNIFMDGERVVNDAYERYPSTKTFKSIVESYKPRVKRVYDSIMSSSLRYSPYIQRAHGLYELATSASYKDVHDYIRGEKVYHIDEGFVTPTEFSGFMKRDGVEHMQSDQRYEFTYVFREQVRNYTFLLIDLNITSFFPNISQISNVIVDNELKRSERIKSRIKSRLDATGDTDLNQWFIDFIDWFIGFFSSSAHFINDQYFILKETFAPENLKRFFSTTFAEWFLRLVTCTVPYNFNGTYVYSPVCVPLTPEYILDWMQMVPTGAFPIQIQWPQDFITQNCTNEFNVPKAIFDFSYSDNCYANPRTHSPQTDGQTRPLCPECDYCERDYDNTCKDIGFSDFIDSVLFFLGAIPKIFDGFYNGVFSTKGVEIPAFWLTLLATTIGRGPWTAITFVIVEMVILWIIDVTFHAASYGLIFVFVTIMSIVIFPFIISTFPFVYLVLGIVILTWLVSLWMPFSFVWLRPLLWFKSILMFANHNLLFWAPNLTPIINRVDRFNYESIPVPSVDVFCYFWTFQNIAIAVLVVFFFFYYSQIWGVFNSNLAFLIYDFYTIAASVIRGNQDEVNAALLQDTRNRFSRLSGAVKDAWSKAKRTGGILVDKYSKWKGKMNKRVSISIPMEDRPKKGQPPQRKGVFSFFNRNGNSSDEEIGDKNSRVERKDVLSLSKRQGRGGNNDST
jgi:hypothetical protein